MDELIDQFAQEMKDEYKRHKEVLEDSWEYTSPSALWGKYKNTVEDLDNILFSKEQRIEAIKDQCIDIALMLCMFSNRLNKV